MSKQTKSITYREIMLSVAEIIIREYGSYEDKLKYLKAIRDMIAEERDTFR